MYKITSFTVDHRKIEPGMYISRTDNDITTYDMRTRKPNCGEYMDNITMHTLEHIGSLTPKTKNNRRKPHGG